MRECFGVQESRSEAPVVVKGKGMVLVFFALSLSCLIFLVIGMHYYYEKSIIRLVV